MFCFKQSFSRLTRKLSQPMISNNNQYEDNLFTFDVTLEIKEDDGKGGYSWPSWLCTNIIVKRHFKHIFSLKEIIFKKTKIIVPIE